MLNQVVHEQGVDLQRGYERAAFVGGSGPIRVAIEEQAQVVPALRDRAEGFIDVGRDRLRVDAAEVRIALGMQLRDTDSTPGQQPRDPRRP